MEESELVEKIIELGFKKDGEKLKGQRFFNFNTTPQLRLVVNDYAVSKYCSEINSIPRIGKFQHYFECLTGETLLIELKKYLEKKKFK